MGAPSSTSWCLHRVKYAANFHCILYTDFFTPAPSSLGCFHATARLTPALTPALTWTTAQVWLWVTHPSIA